MPRPNRSPGPSMPRQGVEMPRNMGGDMGRFRSPSAQPRGFQRDVSSALDSILGQMGTPGIGGQVGLPDFGPQGGGVRRRRHRDTLPTPQDPNAGPSFGPEALNTYAPPINPAQFEEPNLMKGTFKGSKKLDTGGFGGGMGGMFGMMGAGGNPFSSGGMGGMPAGGMDFLSWVFPLLMQQMGGEGFGPRVGR